MTETRALKERKKKKSKHLNLLTVPEVITWLLIAMPSYKCVLSQKPAQSTAQGRGSKECFPKNLPKYALKYYHGYCIIVIELYYLT